MAGQSWALLGDIMKGLDRELPQMGHCIYDVVSVSIGKAGGGGCAASSTSHAVRQTGCSQVPLNYGVQAPLHYGVQVPLNYGVQAPLHYGVQVPLHYGVQVPLHYGVQVPLNYGVQELRLLRGRRRSGAKALFGQVEQRPDHPAEVCGFFARSGHLYRAVSVRSSWKRAFAAPLDLSSLTEWVDTPFHGITF